MSIFSRKNSWPRRWRGSSKNREASKICGFSWCARNQLSQDGADLITFTSSSTVENFLALGLPWPKRMRIASIGPITSKTARDQGLKVDIEARRHDIDGLVEAVRELFEKS